MAEIEEMKIEKTDENMDEMRLENRVQLTKVYFGSDDNFIVVSGNDASIYLKFVNARTKFLALADELDEKELSIREKYKGKTDEEISDEDLETILLLYKDFYKESEKIMDGVFGEGTTRKFWADVFAVIPDYVPTTEAWMDYFDALIPVVERMSDHTVKLEKLASSKRMAKYQPQDHKKPQRKGTK